MSNPAHPESVEEFHGPYGPYNVSELVLQKIWLEQAFDVSRLRDQSGRRIEVLRTGVWNRLDGPDFKDAVLRIDGSEIHGDVEVHFSEADWRAHGHERDPAYDRVVLHVLYHPCSENAEPAATSSGVELARVSLLPLLWFSLEEYAGDDSLIASTGVDLRPEVESLMQFDLSERRRRLVEHAERRWLMKRHFAQLRIERFGWAGACHQGALEVMGFARNRVPMLMIAERYGLEAFASEGLSIEALIATGGDRWRMSGCRPANRPSLRLRQYQELVCLNPAWPTGLVEQLEGVSLPELDQADPEWGSQAFRSAMGVAAVRKALFGSVLGDRIGGAKADTLVCDALLPLFSASSGLECFALWFHWNAGNAPDSCLEALRLLQVVEARRVPLSNGWLQGVLGAKSPVLG